jgi:hypothetical protein
MEASVRSWMIRSRKLKEVSSLVTQTTKESSTLLLLFALVLVRALALVLLALLVLAVVACELLDEIHFDDGI